MKIRLMFFLTWLFIGLQGSQEFSALGVLYPADDPGDGKPLISVKTWKEAKSTIETRIDCASIVEEKWPQGKFFYTISQKLGDQAEVTQFFFDSATGRYQKKKLHPNNLYNVKNLSQFYQFLDQCSYLICIPDEFNYDFVSCCSDFIDEAHKNNIPIAIHLSYLNSKDNQNTMSALIRKKKYTLIDDEKKNSVKSKQQDQNLLKGDNGNLTIQNSKDSALIDDKKIDGVTSKQQAIGNNRFNRGSDSVNLNSNPIMNFIGIGLGIAVFVCFCVFPLFLLSLALKQAYF